MKEIIGTGEYRGTHAEVFYGHCACKIEILCSEFGNTYYKVIESCPEHALEKGYYGKYEKKGKLPFILKRENVF